MSLNYQNAFNEYVYVKIDNDSKNMRFIYFMLKILIITNYF